VSLRLPKDIAGVGVGMLFWGDRGGWQGERRRSFL